MNDKKTSDIAKALLPLVRALCSQPDKIVWSQTGNADSGVITIQPSLVDGGAITGGNGRIIDSLKYLVATAGRKAGKNVVLALETKLTDLHGSFTQTDSQSGFEDYIEELIEPWSKMLLGNAKIEFETKGETLYVKIFAGKNADIASIVALDNVIYPMARKYGRKVKVRNGKRLNEETIKNENITTRAGNTAG